MQRLPASDLKSMALGAPLDAMKCIAATSMCLESANYALNDNASRLLWNLDRWTFPLFSFALAVHIARGFDARGQIASLLVLGALTQPIYTAVFPEVSQVNIFITLAIGAAIASTIAAATVKAGDAALATAVGIALAFPQWSYAWDYGLLGATLPLAMTTALREGGLRWSWPIVLIAATYLGARYGSEDWIETVTAELGFAIAGSAAVIALTVAALKGRPRFLPRYALHAVYPGHLAVILLISWLQRPA